MRVEKHWVTDAPHSIDHHYHTIHYYGILDVCVKKIEYIKRLIMRKQNKDIFKPFKEQLTNKYKTF